MKTYFLLFLLCFFSASKSIAQIEDFNTLNSNRGNFIHTTAPVDSSEKELDNYASEEAYSTLDNWVLIFFGLTLLISAKKEID